jgi:hypothetical protein
LPANLTQSVATTHPLYFYATLSLRWSKTESNCRLLRFLTVAARPRFTPSPAHPFRNLSLS